MDLWQSPLGALKLKLWQAKRVKWFEVEFVVAKGKKRVGA
jgi:hypothetical protein